MAVTRRLVFADVAHQYSVAPAADASAFVAELAAGNGTRAMEFLRREDTVARAFTVVDAAGTERALTAPTKPLTTWACTEFTEEFTAYVRSSPRAGEEGPNPLDDPLAALGPLMLLRTHHDNEQPFTEVLMCSRTRTLGTLFTRVAQFPHSAAIGLAELVATAVKHRTHLEDYVRIESNAYLSYEQGVEIEQKVTLTDEVSIWSLTKDIWTAVENGDFPGFITDPGYELTRWHFVQHNFEVLAPAEEVGHYAFQENPDGRYQLKMKKFSADALRREETFRKGVEVPAADFEGYLAREFPALRFRRLPGFRRTRFDVNVQSVTTGHSFGIETDEVTTSDVAGRTLRQVEMEYLETRRHAGMDAASIDSELNRLTDLVEALLARRGIGAERNLYSKLSFLRDCSSATGR
ncbi:hypothetical protein AB0L71_27495 [Streptomyces sp. NPDC052052]|uniref:hypothetical protein n=1 Tax=Streptomyces sp. NPDC052052 TaxID=3154756 RepID=UPI00342274D1